MKKQSKAILGQVKPIAFAITYVVLENAKRYLSIQLTTEAFLYTLAHTQYCLSVGTTTEQSC